MQISKFKIKIEHHMDFAFCIVHLIYIMDTFISFILDHWLLLAVSADQHAACRVFCRVGNGHRVREQDRTSGSLPRPGTTRATAVTRSARGTGPASQHAAACGELFHRAGSRHGHGHGACSFSPIPSLPSSSRHLSPLSLSCSSPSLRPKGLPPGTRTAFRSSSPAPCGSP